MDDIVKLYLCDSIIPTTLRNENLYNSCCFRNKDEAIVISNACHLYFTSLFLPAICFRELRKYLCKNFFAKRSKDRAASGRIRTINLLDSYKKMLIKGEIFLRHCKGHDTLIIFFSFY